MTSARVAFFTDSFLEVNGVARTSREFARYAREHERPFFSVHTGPRTRSFHDGSVQTHELKHSPLIVPLETDLAFDVLFLRHFLRLRRELKAFRPDLIHVTGPGHIGMLGALLAGVLGVKLVASWHTNVHEFGGRRVGKILRFFPAWLRGMGSAIIQGITLAMILLFYKTAGLLFAPNPELIELLQRTSGSPAYLMQRGIDTDLFSPRQRTRKDNEFVIGYVGRLSPEKNVRSLVKLERRLISLGICNYRFLVVGDGGDRHWLAENLQRLEMPGVLLGEELARAYANMDVFVFPSETDTFGNVVLEAMSSGLPALVSSAGGPKYIIRPGIDGFEAEGVDAFAHQILRLYHDPALRRAMSRDARDGAFSYSWNAVFDGVYSRYDELLGRKSTEVVKAAKRSAVLSHS